MRRETPPGDDGSGGSGGPALGDLVQPFQMETLGVRGRLVRLGPALDAILGGHGYPDAVAAMLAETLSLAAALAGGLKYHGLFTLQTKGDGPLGMMVADVTSDGAVRGYARFDEARLEAAADGGGPVPRLLGAGYMAFTVDQGPDTERYQGITEIEGATLADCAHVYFRRSEQLETAITLASTPAPTEPRAGALMVQRMPIGDNEAGGGSKATDEGWRRAVILMSTAGAGELLDPALAPADFLYRLFHQEGVRVFRTRPLRHACRCSRDKVERTLASFPRKEVEAMTEDGKVTVTCEFCKAAYVYGDVELAALYAP
ncbi:MAG: Hsp33 family molecular chaperone HslO [Rhodospirillales bacterium]|jgi:molecular chaperone Hsp33|nr:Hsp33 family molecular chaperone HslO [Rhodospirillales bacterium]HJO72206.1 Hsp33 family molecular chaperone HslO [Rhodospirillales bacterium]